jgi:hypothetical protein
LLGVAVEAGERLWIGGGGGHRRCRCHVVCGGGTEVVNLGPELGAGFIGGRREHE